MGMMMSLKRIAWGALLAVLAVTGLQAGEKRKLRAKPGEEVSWKVGPGVEAVEGLPPGLTFDPRLGVVRGRAAQEGTFTPRFKTAHGKKPTSPDVEMQICYDCGGTGETRADSNARIISPSGPITVAKGQTISFEATADGGASPRWTFGDGTSATGYSAAKAYSVAGTYTATFLVSANTLFYGSSATVTVTVTDAPPPSISSFTAARNPVLYGTGTTVTPVFSGGSGSIDQGLGAVVSGTSYSTGALTLGKTYTLTVTNTSGISSTRTLTVSVNKPPVFSAALNPQSLVIGKPFSLILPQATDPEGDAITYGVSGLPPGLSFNASTREVSGTPTGAGGLFPVVYTATDSNTFSTSHPTVTFGVAPNQVPVFSVGSIPTLNVAVNQSFILQLPRATDGDQEPLTYSFPNRNSYASNLQYLDINPSTLVLSGHVDTAGTYVLNFQAMDPKGALTVIPFTLNVTSSNPVAFGTTTLPSPSLKVGTAMTSVVLPAATDSGGQAISYTLLGLPTGLAFNPGTREVSGTSLVAGEYSLTYTASVPRGYAASITNKWTVAEATTKPPVFSATLPVTYSLSAESPASIQFPAATDPNPNNTRLDYVLTGALPPGLAYDAATRILSGTPGAGGNYPLTYTVTDSYGLTATQQTTLMVAQDRPSIASFLASRTTLDPGQTSELSWSVSGADTLTLNGSPVSGSSLTVTPAASTLYVLTATNEAGSSTHMLLLNVNGSAPAGGGSTATGLPVPTPSAFTKAQFEEALSYEWAGGTTTSTRSFTGLITAVDVSRALQAGLAGLTTASPKDQALRSRYDYGYDALGQLIRADGSFYNDLSATTAAWKDLTWYTYDAHGNRLFHKPREDSGTAPTREYAYWNQASKGWDTNRLLSVTDSTGTPFGFDYDDNGAVTLITRNGRNQTLSYNDPRFMRLPTDIVRDTADGRLVTTLLRYDMSGTRTYKRDLVTQGEGVVSDRETLYLANGTEVLMEVEKRGAKGAVAPDRYTAYIFGAGSRLARLSWDADGRPAYEAGPALPVKNPDFDLAETTSAPMEWISGGGSAAVVSDPARGQVLRVVRGGTAYAYVEQSLGTYQAGESVRVKLRLRGDGQGGGARVAFAGSATAGTPSTSAVVTDPAWKEVVYLKTLPASGELRVQLLAEGAETQSGYFDAVTVAKVPPATLATGQPNLWPDPGFESVAKLDADTALTGTPALDQEGTNREGLKTLRLPASSTYQRTLRNLTPGGAYLFSIWKKPDGGAWQRETRALTANAEGTINVPLTESGLYDQAELIAGTYGTLPESWIPENRLGRVDWFITDHLGSTKLLIDQNGTHKFTGDDDPFGINLRSFGDKDSHRYTGQILDEEQGLYYYGARYYLPEIGRFLSGDPLHEFLSPFAYVGNAPITRIDPTGNQSKPSVENMSFYDPEASKKQFEFIESVTQIHVIAGKEVVDTIQIKGYFLDSLNIKVYETVGHPGKLSLNPLQAARGEIGFVIDNTGSLDSTGVPSYTSSLSRVVIWNHDLYSARGKSGTSLALSLFGDVGALGAAGKIGKGIKGGLKWTMGLFKPTPKNPLGVVNTAVGVGAGDKRSPVSSLKTVVLSVTPIVGTIKAHKDHDKLMMSPDLTMSTKAPNGLQQRD